MSARLSAIFAAWVLASGCSRSPSSEPDPFQDVDSAAGLDASEPEKQAPKGSAQVDAGSETSPDASLPDSTARDGSSPLPMSADDAAAALPDASEPIDPGWHPWPEGEGPPTTIRLNHLQMMGTHNSYHRAPLLAADASHRYTHKPLDEQLEGGVRAFELDLHGGNDGKIHVYHIQAIDDRTTCSTLVECLSVLKKWSDAKPTHTPIFIWFEIKNDTSITPAIDDVRDVEKEILSVIPAERIITADFIRAGYATPRARVEAEGWPALRDVSGMFTFALIDRDDLASQYSNGNTTLEGRKIWLNANADQHTQPWALITKVGGPDDADEIADALRHDLIVATNSCGVDKTDEVCQGKLDMGVMRGIHMLKDDLPFPISGRAYYGHLPNGSPGCNPVTAQAECDRTLFE